MSVTSKQSADIDIPDQFYLKAIALIGRANTLLNLGCGVRFNFERLLKQARPEIRVTSVDQLELTALPDCLDEYIRRDLEMPQKLGDFDVVTFFEIIEHLDKTDNLLKTCFGNLREGGTLVFSFPNLASIYSRIELMLGYQPHILEVSNQAGHFGTGLFGKLNGNQPHESIHHIRGITHRAMKEFVQFHGFELELVFGTSTNRIRLFDAFPSIAPVNIFVCKKPIVASANMVK